MEASTIITRVERPNSIVFKANKKKGTSEGKLYFNTAKDLIRQIKELKEEGIILSTEPKDMDIEMDGAEYYKE